MIKITSANVGIIDTLSVSNETKARYYDAIAAGNTVYTPTAPFTYANWTGLLSITIDKDGFGSYLIGEGLNGGYTVEEFPEGWRNLLIKFTPGLTAIIVSPKNGDVFMVGQPFKWIADYKSSSIPFVSWREEANLEGVLPEGTPSGPVTIWSGYGTGASVVVGIKKKQLGEKYTDYDKELLNISTKYEIPPDLMKSVIYQESLHEKDEQTGQTVFVARSYRYEAHKDFDWYARSQTDAQNTPVTSTNKCNREWRGITSFPENKFIIKGTRLGGVSVENGAQLPNGYKTWSQYTSGGPLKFDSSSNPTAQELVTKNPAMGWTNRTPCWVGAGSPWNFTAQLVLAASYGLGQVMYETAINRGFDSRTGANQSAIPVEKLFEPKVSIDLSAKHLKKAYDKYGNWPKALEDYNSDPDYAPAVLKRWNNGGGVFKLIVKE